MTFVADLGTAVVGANTGNGGLDVGGAEIDLFGSNDAFFWNPGNTGTQGETSFGAIGSTVTLTSGTANYAGSTAISGADIIMNSNAGAIYTLDVFRRILTHEIGHAIGLGDVEGDISPGRFIDDNYDGTNSATALATLTNSWALLVNPLNPGASRRCSASPSPSPTRAPPPRAWTSSWSHAASASAGQPGHQSGPPDQRRLRHAAIPVPDRCHTGARAGDARPPQRRVAGRVYSGRAADLT